MKAAFPVRSSLAAMTLAFLAGCSTTVKNYGPNDHFSLHEFETGSTSTPAQCAQTLDAVWVDGSDYHECVRYFPSKAFAQGRVDRAVVFLEGDKSPKDTSYEKNSPQKWIDYSNAEEKRDAGLAFMYIGRPGTDGSSGNQNRKRTHYEMAVVNAAIDKIKDKYGVKEFALVGQSGGGGIVAALIAERSDVLCAVSSSGVTSVVFRAKELGLGADLETRTPFTAVWDPINQLARAHPMPGFRMFVTSDRTDQAVSYTSQANYVQAAKKAGLPIEQIQVHAAGDEHHVTGPIGDRVAQTCMAGLPTEYIVRTFTGVNAGNMDADALAAGIRRQAQAKN